MINPSNGTRHLFQRNRGKRDSPSSLKYVVKCRRFQMINDSFSIEIITIHTNTNVGEDDLIITGVAYTGCGPRPHTLI